MNGRLIVDIRLILRAPPTIISVLKAHSQTWCYFASSADVQQMLKCLRHLHYFILAMFFSVRDIIIPRAHVFDLFEFSPNYLVVRYWSSWPVWMGKRRRLENDDSRGVLESKIERIFVTPMWIIFFRNWSNAMKSWRAARLNSVGCRIDWSISKYSGRLMIGTQEGDILPINGGRCWLKWQMCKWKKRLCQDNSITRLENTMCSVAVAKNRQCRAGKISTRLSVFQRLSEVNETRNNEQR